MHPKQALLELVERHPRLSSAQLAAMLGCSAEEVDADLQELEEKKVILKYHTFVDWEKAGVHNVTACIEVRLTPQREVGFDGIAENIYRYPEVCAMYLMSGSFDLMVFVEDRTLKEVADFVATKLSTIEGVMGTSTNFMLKKYKEAGIVLEDDEEDRRLAVTP